MFSSIVTYSLVIHLCLSETNQRLEKQKINLKLHGIHEPDRKNRKPVSLKTVEVDGITHFEIKNTRQGRDLNKIEELFKNALLMKGVNFIYKRDMFWRTWREITLSNGSRITVFYKCSHIINTKCEHCYGGGFWKIDKDPVPCPYEILSMVNRNQLCVANYEQINKINKSCPSVSSLVDLMFSCENPILTMYRFTNMFTAREETNICKGRENCDIATLYRTYDNYVLFRIMNSSNDVIYSKVMRHDKKNFACNNNCGRLDPVTMKLVKNFTHQQITPSLSKNGAKGKKTVRKKKKTTASPCRKLQATTEDYFDEDYGDRSISVD